MTQQPPEILLTTEQAYKAMFEFLNHYWEQTTDEGVAILLGGMQLLEDGRPMDSAMWTDWVASYTKVLTA